MNQKIQQCLHEFKQSLLQNYQSHQFDEELSAYEGGQFEDGPDDGMSYQSRQSIVLPNGEEIDAEDVKDDELDRMLQSAIHDQKLQSQGGKLYEYPASNRNSKQVSQRSHKPKHNFLNKTASFQNKQSQIIPANITIKQMRELERQQETAHLGPGAYYEPKPFGDSSDKKMTIGSVRPEKPNENPGPGTYNIDKALAFIKPTSQSVIIKPEIGFKVPVEVTPSPGQYDGHIKPFGADVTFTPSFGSPYKFVPNSNPPPGLYDPAGADSIIRPRSPSTRICKPLIEEKRIQDVSPQCYDGHLKPFGEDIKTKVGFGSKYEFKVNDVPPPGYYSPEKAMNYIKPKSPSVKFHTETLAGDVYKNQGNSFKESKFDQYLRENANDQDLRRQPGVQQQ